MSILNVEQAINQALQEEMHRDSRVMVMGEGVAKSRAALLASFGPQRVRNTPLAEAVISGTAVGAAATGLRPVVDLLFAPFLTYAMDALVNSAGKLRYLSGGQHEFPLVTLSMTGAGWCVGAQHNHNLEAMFVHAPGLKVVMPSTPADFKGLIKTAIRDNNPVLVFTDLSLLHASGEVPDETEFLVPLGKAAVSREGTDVTLVSYAKTVNICLESAKQLEEFGISAEVIDLRSLKPLDEETVLRSVRKTGRLVIVQEASGLCGMAAEIAALAVTRAFEALRAPVVRLTGPDAPAAASWVLEQATVPTAGKIVQAVREMLPHAAPVVRQQIVQPA
ncbi:pyruvate dehydrogenase E1 component beta subunit [Marinobacter daqiaonensis]|uniref:Branched-chain alpha-keto acid dehydrogenase E1 component beta chain n=1 Tax=Marinobacter daqiaonensis TaxID=650891 RepID=A0A1I6GRT8_9GAMM|nr:alpha-ketoacid dehydrogenase subunit beta [Marinobacter daqiaonensis]SFR44801.1 pyruvate dehydrogenase E1 component beta subunit [Marinobacter daqiaonensis]